MATGAASSGEWLVQVQGKRAYLEALMSHLQNPQCKVVNKEEGFYLCSNKFQNNDNPRDVYSMALDMLHTINGVGTLALDGFEPIKALNVVRTDSTGAIAHRVLLAGVGRFNISGSALASTSGATSTPNLLDWVITLAGMDDSVERALRLICSDQSIWFKYYKLYEIVIDDVGKANLSNYGTPADFDRFTGTANHPAASGDDSRHAIMKGTGPRNTMTEQEATTFINTVISTWLNKKRIQYSI